MKRTTRGVLQPFDEALGLEHSSISRIEPATQHAADENAVAFVEFDACGQALVRHAVHGVILQRWRSSRTSSTWHLLASLPCNRSRSVQMKTAA